MLRRGKVAGTESIQPRCVWLRSALLPGLLTLGLAGTVVGQEPPAAKEDGLRTSSRAEYGAELARMTSLVEACRAHVPTCDEKAVPADEAVEDGKFQVHWDWLRVALKKGADEKDKDREVALASAGARLQEDAAELAGKESALDEAGARHKLEQVLGRGEFGHVQEVRWWQTVLAKLDAKVEGWLQQVGEVIPWSPWMGIVFEWGILGAAAAALIVWALRMSKQQRVAFKPEREADPAWQAESDDWAAKAKEQAASGEWRDAVHCLYWSAIVMLEGQKLWRQNRARTPREYVGLLPPDSPRRRVLGGLTGVFERIWYGIRPATSGDYEKASALLDELRVG